MRNNNVTSTPDNHRTLVTWGPLAAVLVTIGVYVLSQFGAAVALRLYPALMGWSETEAEQWLGQSVYSQFFYVLIIDALALSMLKGFLTVQRTNFRALGLKRPQFSDLGYALAGYGVYFVGYLITLRFMSAYLPAIDTEQEQNIGFGTDTGGPELWLVLAALVVLTPIVEEIITRGFLYTGLRSRLSIIPAALVTSVIFAAAHLQPGTGEPLLWIAAIDTFILSLVLVYLREKTDSLTAPILLHMIKNAIAFAVLFLVVLD